MVRGGRESRALALQRRGDSASSDWSWRTKVAVRYSACKGCGCYGNYMYLQATRFLAPGGGWFPKRL